VIRAIYILLLRLHPRRFRREFAEEMLWIFDQARGMVEGMALVGDAMRSLATQWMFRSEFGDQPVVAMAGPAADRVPSFYTSESEIPPPAALVNGLLGAFVVFGMASFALMHSGGNGRLTTYSSNQFHEGAPGNGGDPVDVQSKAVSAAGQPTAGAPPMGPLESLKAMLGESAPTPSSPKSEPTDTGEPRPSMVLPPPPPGQDAGRAHSHLAMGPIFVPAGEQSMVLQKVTDAKEYFSRFPVLAALDADHDGVIAPEEIINAPSLLLAVDKNHDGKLDAEEGGWHSPYRTVADMVQSLMKYDRNLDGKLQRGELPRVLRGQFDRYDSNRDGVLAGDEIRNFAAGMMPKPPDGKVVKRARLTFMRTDRVLAALDLNHDGEISASEIRNAEASLKTLDRDYDGYLRLDEVVPSPVDQEAAWLFRLDEDFDGRISHEEAQKPIGKTAQGLLEAADRNGDGFVTWDELVYEIRLRVDANRDGMVTWDEMRAAQKSGALFAPAAKPAIQRGDRK
jgi:Ca2+-binding EF-hand superfamily protein